MIRVLLDGRVRARDGIGRYTDCTMHSRDVAMPTWRSAFYLRLGHGDTVRPKVKNSFWQPSVTRLAVRARKRWTESLCLWTSAGGCKLDLRIARVATCAEDHLKNPAKLHRRRVRGRSSPPRDMAVWPD